MKGEQNMSVEEVLLEVHQENLFWVSEDIMVVCFQNYKPMYIYAILSSVHYLLLLWRQGAEKLFCILIKRSSSRQILIFCNQ